MRIDKKKLRLLLVDDDLIARIAFRTILEKEGYSVDDAENGIIAINKFQQHKYDVILMDYHMPDMNGATITEEIRLLEGVSRTTIIIGVTAHIDPKVKAVCMKSGMDKVVSKPVDINKINKLLDGFYCG